MAQQITIIVLVDTVGAFDANQLEGNIYLVDNLRTEGSQNIGTGGLVTSVNGTYWSNGAQASEPVFNWLISGLSSLPPTLPRNYAADRTSQRDRQALEALRTHAESLSKGEAVDQAIEGLVEAAAATGVHPEIENEHGHVGEHGTKLLNRRGEVVSREEEVDPDDVSHLTPFITDITGEAVDEGILYPAQYGSPVPIHDGWYWSASASTHRPGVYSYTMHIRVFKLVIAEGRHVWQSKEMTYESRIRVRSRPVLNGFTGGGIGLLPIC